MRRLAIVLGLLFIAAFAAADEKFIEKRVVAHLDADGVQRASITGGEYFFDPNVIVVKVNAPVELTLKKEPGITPHDFVLKAPEAGIDVKADLATEPKIVKFTATKPGRYPFECSERLLFFKSHKDKGMHGFLEVVEGERRAGDKAQGADQPPAAKP